MKGNNNMNAVSNNIQILKHVRSIVKPCNHNRRALRAAVKHVRDGAHISRVTVTAASKATVLVLIYEARQTHHIKMLEL